MTLKERVKLYTTKTAIKGALKVLPKISDERWLSLIKGRVYRLKKKDERDFLENLLINLKNMASKVSPQIREKIVLNLINNATIQGQPYTENHLRPCCIIDNPHILRDIIAETGAYPTHEGAESIVGCLAKPLDMYASGYKGIADKAWEEDYVPEEGETAV